MSRTRKYAPATLAVVGRMYEAVDALIAGKVIRGSKTYCVAAGIDRRHWAAQRKEPARGYFEVAWLLPLVSRYGVSPRWLLLGEGAIFRKGFAAGAEPPRAASCQQP